MREFEECLPYKKKSQTRPPKKSKHKHEYKPCVLEYNDLRFSREHGVVYDRPAARFDRYCPVCGKLGGLTATDIERWYTHRYASRWVEACFTEEAERELNPDTRTLPTFWVDDPYFPKYVEVNDGKTD